MPSWDDASVRALASRLRLRLDPRRRLRQGGGRLGAGPGASLEFHDHRAYMPGDDLRHLDWNVVARTDQLVLRRHRREVSPRLEILLDHSASMGTDPAKASLAAAIAALLGHLATGEGARLAIWALGSGAHPLPAARDAWIAALTRLECAGAAGLESEPGPRLHPGGERVLISDGLCPGGGHRVIQRLGREAATVSMVQILRREELEPTPLGPVRLEDVEGGAVDMVHDEAACQRYRERLERHLDGWREALHGRGAGLLTLVVEDVEERGFHEVGHVLVRAGLLEAAA